MNYRKYTLAAWLVCWSLLVSTTVIYGQERLQRDGTTNTQLIPDTAVAAMIMHPREILFHPKLKWIPREILAAQSKLSIGVDATLIDQLTLVLPVPSQDAVELEFAAIMHCSEDQLLAGQLIEQLNPTTLGGRKAFVDPQGYLPSVVSFDSQTVILGTPTLVKDLLNKPEGDLSALIKRGNVKGLGRVYWNAKASRDFYNQLIQDMPPFQGPLEQVKKFPNLLDDISAGWQYSERLQLDIVMTAVSQSAAEEVTRIIENSLTYLHAVLLDELSKNFDTDDPVQAATVEYINRVWDKYEHKLVPEVTGRTLKIQLHEEVLALPMLAGVFGSNQQSLVDTEGQPKIRLRQVALGMHNYDSAYGHFPPAVIRDESGRPLFSGMVGILPFIEQQNLHSQLDLTQPWNSAANRELTSIKIQMFSDIDGEGAFRLPVFPGSVWDGEEPKAFRDIRDGSSNTIMAIQAPPEVQTSWADPTPWKISETDPKRSIFGDRDSVWVAWMDGSVSQLRKSEVTTEQLKAMLTIAGGEIVNRVP